MTAYQTEQAQQRTAEALEQIAQSLPKLVEAQNRQSKAISGSLGKLNRTSQAKASQSEEKLFLWFNIGCLAWVALLDIGVFVYRGVTTRPQAMVEDVAGVITGTGGIFDREIQEGDKIAGYTVTSGYGPRTAPTAGASTDHKGVDLDTPTATALYMPGDGTVECKSQPSGAGNYAVIKPDDSPFTFRALHLSNCAEGTHRAGQIVAKTGNTGISTGPHLDWQQLQNGEHVHPTEGWLQWALTGNPPAFTKSDRADISAANLDDEQREVIADIVAVAAEVGASRQDLKIAIATCLVESQCKTGSGVRRKDHDSIGAFQQRPSQSWPDSEETAVQAKAFFEGHGTNQGLLDLPATDRARSPGQSAQRVQRSAHPGRYAERMGEAEAIVDSITESK